MESCKWCAVSICITSKTHFSTFSMTQKTHRKKSPFFLAKNGFHLSHDMMNCTKIYSFVTFLLSFGPSQKNGKSNPALGNKKKRTVGVPSIQAKDLDISTGQTDWVTTSRKHQFMVKTAQASTSFKTFNRHRAVCFYSGLRWTKGC